VVHRRDYKGEGMTHKIASFKNLSRFSMGSIGQVNQPLRSRDPKRFKKVATEFFY